MTGNRPGPGQIRGWVVIGVLLLSIVGAGSLRAQLTTGSISGTIKDQSEGVLPGATITVTNVETGITRSAVSGGRGEFRVQALPVGTYDVQASMAGFQSGVRKGITLTLGRDAVVDFTLQVGNVAEQVTVTGEAPLIETTTSTVGGVVDPKQMRDIPLNARSFIELVPLQAGAVFADSGERSATKGFGRKLSIVGTRYNTNSFLLDGADINDVTGSAGSAAGTVAGVETVREFRVITNAYDAEYGRHTGGVISAITKSGTNEFHGSLFEFLRNDNVDAARWEDNAFNRGQKPEFRRNQFGGALGGPILHDRTFFFGSYEGLREALGTTRVFNVPGFAVRGGQLPSTSGTLSSVAIDPTMQPYLQAYPQPNVPCSGPAPATCVGSAFPFDRSNGTGQFSRSDSEVTDQDYGNVRIDHRISDADALFGRFNIDNAQRAVPGMNIVTQSSTNSRFATIEETHIFSPSLLARTHFSFNRTNLRLFDLPREGFNFPRLSFSDQTEIPGIISVTTLTGWGGSSTNPKAYVQNNFQFKQDIYYTSGRHSIKFGGQSSRFQFNQQANPFYPSGQFDFAGLRDFMTKQPNAAHFVQPGSTDIRGWRQTVIGLYVHDDISLRPGLTVNLGVRYEFATSPTEANGRIATIRDISPAHLYTVTPEQTDVGEPYFLNPSLKNFAPRVGFAWSPFQNGKTSLRGGFGIFHDQLLPVYYQTAGARIPPYFAVAEMFRENLRVVDPNLVIDFPTAYFTQTALLAQNIGSVPQADGFQWKVSQPAVMKWSLNVERQVTTDTTVEAGYSATRGTHLVRGNLNLNATPATTINGRRFILIDQLLPNQKWGRMRWRIIDGASDYHGLLLSATKRFSRGFQLQSSYTFSRSTDDSSTFTGSSDFGSADRTGYRGEKEHALSSFDVRQSFITNVTYELPGAQLDGVAGTALGGWSLSSIIRLNSGNPLNMDADQPRAGSLQMRFVEGSTLDLVPGGNQNPVNAQNPDQYFDVNQFAFPATNCMTLASSLPVSCDASLPRGAFQGNLGRNVLISPGVANVDFTLMKNTPLTRLRESASLQFRAEFFNLFNRPNFGIPALNLFERTGVRRAGAGQITSTRFNSRQMQFALKLVF